LNPTEVEWQTNKTVELHIPTVLYEAVIQDDVILSYSSCQLRNVEIHPREYGILCLSKKQSVWVEGSLGVQQDDRSNNILGVQNTTVQKPKKALDLFCGIRNSTRVLTEWGVAVTSVEIDPKYHPHICCAVLTWEYTRFPCRRFDV